MYKERFIILLTNPLSTAVADYHLTDMPEGAWLTKKLSTAIPDYELTMNLALATVNESMVPENSRIRQLLTQ